MSVGRDVRGRGIGVTGNAREVERVGVGMSGGGFVGGIDLEQCAEAVRLDVVIGFTKYVCVTGHYKT
jgi:hypothetical protein